MMQIKTIEIDNPIYPQKLKDVKKAPKRMYMLGDENLLKNPKISIVGSRANTEYGKKMALNFAKKLSEKGYTITSGLANGIDTYSHMGGLLGIGKTIAVLPSGFNNISSKTNQKLFYEIIENGGLIITQYMENTEVSAKTLEERNKIVAVISKGVLVVEGDYRTGTTITVKHARENGVPIFCIPGNLDNSKSYTPNQLIKQGAFLITNEKDIIEIVENKETNVVLRESKMVFELKLEEEYMQKMKTKKIQEERRCRYLTYQFIKQEPIDADTIVNISHLNINQINYELTMLQIEGYIKELPGKMYVRVS